MATGMARVPPSFARKHAYTSTHLKQIARLKVNIYDIVEQQGCTHQVRRRESQFFQKEKVNYGVKFLSRSEHVKGQLQHIHGTLAFQKYMFLSHEKDSLC